jgi:hypothetical protein
MTMACDNSPLAAIIRSCVHRALTCLGEIFY